MLFQKQETMTSQKFTNHSIFKSFFAHHFIAFWLFIVACSFSAHAQSFTIVRSSIGPHLGSSFQTSNSLQYNSQYIVGQTIASTSINAGGYSITQGFVQPMMMEDTFTDFINDNIWDIELVTYPNPVIQTLFVDVKQHSDRSINFLISDLYGRTVLRNWSKANQTSIDVSSLAAGAYLLQAQIGARTIVKRFVKRTNY